MNKVIISGRFTKDPEIRYTQSKKAIASFRLAVDDGKGKDGEKKTQFIDLEAWEARAELIDRYFTKGDPIQIIGKVVSENWTDKDGNKRTTTKVRVESIEWPLQKAKKPDTFTDIEESDADLPF